LHFGSLVAAVGSYLAARSVSGQWLVRIDDLDPPREIPGAATDILKTLERFGLFWDGPVTYQSQHQEAYAAALARLHAFGLLYPCTCSRAEIAASAQRGSGGMIYPGTCRGRPPKDNGARALRIRVGEREIRFADCIQSTRPHSLQHDTGDFVVRRKDGLFAYHLAVVVDDAAAKISHVVRGNDLLASTPPQIYLQSCLGFATPSYMHLPVARNMRGNKLSKQAHATAIDNQDPSQSLVAALRFLGHEPPAELRAAPTGELLSWAVGAWQLTRVPPSQPDAVSTVFC
jgi:glutamyl-Q tRNA(Asp) synthetase